MAFPTFTRIEIRHTTKADLVKAAWQLRTLAHDLEVVAGQNRSDEDTAILAHHRMRKTSAITRGNGNE